MKEKEKEITDINIDKKLEYYRLKNDKDFIIKLLLVVIIIMLLLHNCGYVRFDDKKNRNLEPSGNVDIFEIQCSNNNCNTNNNDSYTNKDNFSSDNINSNTGNSNKHISKNDNFIDNNKNIDSDSENDSSDDNSGNVEVIDSNITWKSTNNLRIFSNPVYNMEKIIAPESSNAYQFVVKNNTNYNVLYDMKFIEDNDYHINMKYKLKMDGKYIAGSSDKWVSYSELSKTHVSLNSGENHSYYLDWKWVSSDNDTEAGAYSAPYELSIEIKAEQKNG